MNFTLRFAILAAVSTREQAASDKTSLPNQIKDARAIAQSKGWVESAGPFSIPGQSRSKYINLRDAEAEIPALRKLLDSASRGEYDVLVMQDHDRFRSLLRAVYQALCDYRVQLYSLAQTVEPVPPEQFDPYANDSAEMYIGVSEMRSAAEISRMRRKYRTGMRDRVRVHGLPVQLPYGYHYPPRFSRIDKPVPVPDDDLVPHLIEIKERLLKGKSIRQLIEYLNEHGLPPPRGKAWHPDTVRNILKNPFYAGIVRFEVSKVKKDRRMNRVERDRSQPEKAISAQGKHQPIWTLDEHREIVAEFRRRSRRTGTFLGRKNNQFTGLLKCGECGASMWRYGNGPRTLKDRLIYRCSENRVEHAAIPHEYLVEKVGAQLLRSLRPYVEDREIPGGEAPPVYEPPPPNLDELRTELRRLEIAYRKGRYDPNHYEEDWQQLNQQIHEIEYKDELTETERQARQTQLTTLVHKLGPYLEHLPYWLATNDPADTNRVLHLLLEKIVVTPLGHDHAVELVFP